VLPDLIILDLMLPGMDGYEVCRQLKSNTRTASIPLIMLTARAEEVDKVLGFELGADDYVTKPFSPRELVARVKARLRFLAPPAGGGEELRCGEIVIRPDRFQVLVGDKEVKLSVKEFSLLYHLASHPGRIFTRDQLLLTVWGYNGVYETRTVDVHVRYLRRKIEPDPANPQYIETVRGVGYRFRRCQAGS
jgi:DNA-binding response OmpR family regulator